MTDKNRSDTAGYHGKPIYIDNQYVKTVFSGPDGSKRDSFATLIFKRFRSSLASVMNERSQ